jgi:hypothetical protein
MRSGTTLIELYGSWDTTGTDGEDARAVLSQTHWFSVHATFDPKTAEALPQALTTYLSRVARGDDSERLCDRLWRITEHARTSAERLARVLNESPRRDHAIMPVRAVRELDANSFIRLSNRPGRTIREKLSSKPYLQAVRRYQSVDLPENRLFKAFVSRLAELLLLRKDYLGEEEDSLVPKIQAWLLTDRAEAISRWENLPPNNTLLSHRDYRRIWDAWRWLQTLDDDVSRDALQLDQRRETVELWTKYAQMYRDGTYRFAEMPVLFDYERFEIRPWCGEPCIQKAKPAIGRSFMEKEIHGPVCVDLTLSQPRYASSTQPAALLRQTYIWQHWRNDSECVDIDLFNSDAVYLHPEASSITSPDLFFHKVAGADHLDLAARAFATKLRDTCKHDTLLWLVPDFLTDFDVEVIRRNLNACFPDAEPIPRSIAAIFEQVDYSKIKQDGFSIAVVDCIGGRTCVTKLVARHDTELGDLVPETRGFYWERCPPVVIANTSPETDEAERHGHFTVDRIGHWRAAPRPYKPGFIDPSSLKSNSRIGQFAFLINLTESPVVGGVRLHSLQEKARGIPLWRDQIPELSIKVMKNGRYQRFHLVSRGTTVKPIRGMSVAIPVEEDFALPAGRPYYQFPLFQGENADELGFSARLDSSALPLATDVVCRLNLTFEYGADEPYKLTFCPLDNSFPPVRTTWRRTEDGVITDASVPEYPSELSWSDLQRWVGADGQEIDLLEWLLDSLARLEELIKVRCAVTITSHWRPKKDQGGKPYWFSFASTESGQCYCNSKAIIEQFGEDPNEAFPPGTRLYGNVSMTAGGLAAHELSASEHCAPSQEYLQRLQSFREKSLQNRMAVIWADGRSLGDTEVPDGFKDDFNDLIISLSRRLPEQIVRTKMLLLHACLHKDTTNECVQWAIDQVEDNSIRDVRAIGFLLGSVTEDWQKWVLTQLVSRTSGDALRVFAYAIWRERHFVEKFTLSELTRILSKLSNMLSEIEPCPSRRSENDKWIVRNWVRATAEPLELLLGLLRTRASEDPEIRMLLQPQQRITKNLAKQVERVTDLVAEANVPLFSRVQIDVMKPDGDRTPALLYALRLYLTGDDGANAIHIASVADGD